MSRKAATPRLTRAQKLQQEREAAKSAVMYEAPYQPAKLVPMNQNQKLAKSMLDSGTPVVMLTGSAGTGKSLLAAYRVANLLNSKTVPKAYLVRPAVAVGKSIGLLPGTIEEKLAPYFAQTLAHLGKFMKPGDLAYDLNPTHKKIEMIPVEYLRGMSFENCVVLCEEAQNLNHSEMEMMLTRLGDNCQFIFTGDTKQNDLRSCSGLDSTITLIDKTLEEEPEHMTDDDLLSLDCSIGVVKFTPQDVVRSGLTKALVTMYYHADEGFQ